MSAEQVAANLAAALISGNAQDAESALASMAAAVEDGVEFPEADNGPIKAPLAVEDIAAVEDEIEVEDGLESDDIASLNAAEDEGLSLNEDDDEILGEPEEIVLDA